MIEIDLSLTETRWLLQQLPLDPHSRSPLGEVLAIIPPLPPDSPVAETTRQALRNRGLLTPAETVNPFLGVALRWVSTPDRVWSLGRQGPGETTVTHLAVREGAAVECRLRPDGVRLRFPLPESELAEWLRLQLAGGPYEP